MRKYIIVILAILYCSVAHAQISQEQILQAVDKSSSNLIIARAQAQSMKKEARVGNSLPNPEIGYTHQWGNSATAGTQDEFTASQSFDFPSAYFQRGKIVKSKTLTADANYSNIRTNELLSAQLLILQIKYLQEQMRIDSMRYADALFVENLNKKRAEAGQTTALQENKISMQKLSAKSAITRTRVALSTACTQLNNMCNMGITPNTKITTPPIITLSTLDELLATAKEKDMYLSSAGFAINTASNEKSLAYSLALPKLSAGYKFSKTDGANFNGFTVGMSIPLFQSRNTVKAAVAKISEAQSKKDDIYQDLKSEITAHYQEAMELQGMIAEFQAATFGAKNSTLLHKALDAGKISILEYFVELDIVYQNMSQYNDMMYSYASACAKLNKYSL
ncbi:MAG: TolC family protein [Flavobacteriales bacterium]|nr:TolC family protein [Flavobacteriales bacterium]